MMSIQRFVAAFIIFILSTSAFAKVNVAIMVGKGGHESTAAGVEAMLDRLGLTHTRIYVEGLYHGDPGDEEGESEYLKAFTNDPESLNRQYDAYVMRARRAKSISHLDFAQWFSREKFLKALDAAQPDVLVSVYYHPNEMLQRLYEEQLIENLPILYIATDYGRDSYLTRLQPKATAITKSVGPEPGWVVDAVRRGVNPRKLASWGMPFNPAAYRQLTPSQVDQLRSRIGLETGRWTIFLGGGSFGVGRYDKLVESLQRSFAQDRAQIVVATGKSQQNFEAVRELAEHSPENIKIVPLAYDPELPMIQKYLADVVITKAGGLTTTELTYMRKNVVLIDPAVNMERANRKFFVENGLALAADVDHLGDAAKRFLTDEKLHITVRMAQDAMMANYHPERVGLWIADQIRKQERGLKPKPSISDELFTCQDIWSR